MTVWLTRRALREIGPAVDREMARWQAAASAIADPFLREQALASQKHKRFHAMGGSVYALLAPGGEFPLVRLVVALQTISDYLDNLCDRGSCQDLTAYRQLHRALLAAVDPAHPGDDYYRYYPHRDDAGYLATLVETCQEGVARLPSARLVREPVLALLRLYADLQVYKHGPVAGRVARLRGWFDAHRHRWPGLYWWEFAAATGSTLGVFALLAAAADPQLSPSTVQAILAAYFPWICGWHILLDYLIDQEEDLRGGDLNLVSFYPGPGERRRRLTRFAREATLAASRLPHPAFHRWVVQGLPALYLSDPKVKQQRLGGLARRLLAAGGPASWLLYGLACLQRQPWTARLLPRL